MRNLGGCRGPWGVSMGRGRSLAVSPVTAVNKVAQRLTLKLAALIFNQLNHSPLKCKLYLNLHVYFFFFFFFTEAPPKSSPPISTSVTATSRTGEHTHTHTQTKSYAWWKKYLKHVHILENVVNICIINDLSYPPATQITRMHFFYYPTHLTHGLSTAPADINRHPRITTAQISTASLGCRLPSWGDKWVEICMCRLCEKDAFHTRSGNRTTLEYVDVIIHIMRFGPYELREFYQRRM